MKVKLGLAVLGLLVSSSCYSEEITGTTGNAAANGYVWYPQTLFPVETGLVVDSFQFRFNVNNDGSPLSTELTTENAVTGDTLLRLPSYWTGSVGPQSYNSSGRAIPGVPGEYWGRTEFNVQGNAEAISDVHFSYGYTYDPCVSNPLYSPECPNYQIVKNATTVEQVLTETPTTVSPYGETDFAQPQVLNDPVVDDIVFSEPATIGGNQIALANEAPQEEMDGSSNTEGSSGTESDREVAEVSPEISGAEGSDDGDTEAEAESETVEEKDKGDLERSVALEVATAATLEAQTAAQNNLLSVMAFVPNFSSYQTTIPGGVYEDAPGYAPSTVPESRRGLRNGLAQQLLHEKMVEMQY